MDGQTERKKPNYSYQPKGYWTETGDDGEVYYCHKIRQRNEVFIIKKSLRELAEILNQAVSSQNAQKV